MPVNQINEFKIQSSLQSGSRIFKLNRSCCRFESLVNKDIICSQTKNGGGRSYLGLSYNQGTKVNPKNHNSTFCAIWLTLVILYPTKTRIYVIQKPAKFFNSIILRNIEFTNGWLFKDYTKLKKMNDFCSNAFEFDSPKKRKLFLIHYTYRKKTNKSHWFFYLIESKIV